MPNRLARESSPYLLQHADNPVDWYPWGDEAFEEARRTDRPVFLSVGYATCHWCHVMEHESFEDPEVAALMNEAFINVKVDREERPDVDQVYMTVCQLLTGSGGWPLTILMTPEKTPFFAATYLPRSSRYGRVGMRELVPRVRELWSADRDNLLESARQVADHLARTTVRDRRGEPSPGLADAAFRELSRRFDARHGGFGDRPKFPSPHNLLFLLRHGTLTGDDTARSMVDTTLHAMRRGGIWDHVGFGFHRYSTDPEWLVPHFEKMLYDQAMMALACCEAFAATGDPGHAQTAREIIAYVRRDLAAPEGGFHSAEDADSEGEEGRFYLWTEQELRSVLDPEQAELVIDLFRVDASGNYLDEATRARTGANILHLEESPEQAAARLGLDPGALAARLEAARRILFEVRERRVRPLKDDKILADWNGLMAAALARAGRLLGDADAVAAGRRAVEFVLTAMRSESGRLLHRYRAGSASVPAFLDDHAFLAWACLELYDATLEPVHLERALELTETAHSLFWDAAAGGYFFAAEDSEKLLVRPKEVYDGAIPSGNSVAMANLVRLWRLTGRGELAERADAVGRAFARDLETAPSGHTHMIAALEALAAPSVEVVIAGRPTDLATQGLVDAFRRRYLPYGSLLLVPDDDTGSSVRVLAPFAAAHNPVDGQPAAYLCRDFTCELPTTDPDRLAGMLEADARRPGG